jgi:hypothetical protein
MRTLRLLPLFLLPALAFGQSTAAGTFVDLFAQFGNAIDNLVVSDGSLFQATANQWLEDFGAIALFVLILRSFLKAGSAPWLLEYAVGFLTAKFLLLFYSTPTAFLGGSSVSHFFMDTFKGLANQVDVNTIQTVLTSIDGMVTGMEVPSVFSPLKLITYLCILGDCVLLEAIIWIVTLAGLLGTGIGAAIGALFIPWFVFPATRFLTVRWLNFMLLTSAYRLVGALYVGIFAHVMLTWTSYMSDTHLASLLMLLVPTLVITLTMVILTFFIFHWTHDLFAGAVSAGLSGGGAALAALRFFV